MAQPDPVPVNKPAHIHNFSGFVRPHHFQEGIPVEHAMAEFQIVLMDFREFIVVHDIVERNIAIETA